MNEEKNKVLTEAMGECWHKFSGDFWHGNRCAKCGVDDDYVWQPKNSNFSTPDGFFKLWEWAQKQEWFEDFRNTTMLDMHLQKDFSYINPDRFADAVYGYLSREGKS